MLKPFKNIEEFHQVTHLELGDVFYIQNKETKLSKRVMFIAEDLLKGLRDSAAVTFDKEYTLAELANNYEYKSALPYHWRPFGMQNE